MRLRTIAVLIGAASLMGLVAVPGSTAAPQFDRACGIPPGDGYVKWVRVANMTCRHGIKVSYKARKKFCEARNDCSMRKDTDFYRGSVKRNGWRCKVAVGWEYFRAKCRKGNMRVIYLTGA